MSLTHFGLPPAVIRMKARREQREAQDFAQRVYNKIMGQREEEQPRPPPEWVRWMAQEGNPETH